MLEVKNLGFNVKDEVDGKNLEIIDDISFTLDDGKFLVITGPNGGGKSTLARLIMGIEHPTKGQIIYNGTDVTNMSITERANLGIGYAFQQPPRFKGLTVRRLLSLAHGSELPEDECCSYLTQVGLCSMDYLNREVDASLSGGEVKRIEIATLMARELGLAIYDEPEAGIDLWSFSMLVKSFKRISSARNESVMIISHQERIMQLADEIIVIADGRIRTKGTKEEILPTLMGEFDRKCDLRGSDSKEGDANA
jgi:Fe-S cluster assembly ATP-binding protein